MSVDPAFVREYLRASMGPPSGSVLTKKEIHELDNYAKQAGGFDVTSVQAAIETLETILQRDVPRRALGRFGRRTRINQFLQKYRDLLPQRLLQAPKQPGKTPDYVTILLQEKSEPAPTDPTPTPAPAPAPSPRHEDFKDLARKGFLNTPVQLGSDGSVRQPNQEPINFSDASLTDIDALWALARPNQLEGVPADTLKTYAARALGFAQSTLSAPMKTEKDYRAFCAGTAGLAGACRMIDAWDEQTITAALDVARAYPTRLGAALVHQALGRLKDKGALNPEQQTQFDAITMAEGTDEVLKAYHQAIRETAATDAGRKITGGANAWYLRGLSYARNAEADTNLRTTLGEWARAAGGRSWSEEAVQRMDELLAS